ncbi:MAG: ABC transporter ATP-binding protein [Catonella sp.]|uniref:ABC transporter ATP-binding protein n=1 Tax=Catonella sp. TaxID=2382125 RepID=UPI003F9EF202
MEESKLLKLDKVSMEFSDGKDNLQVLNDISIEVNKGEFITILGPSGCGKSTLLNLIAGFEKPLSGEVLFLGEKVEGPDFNRGFVFQDPTLYPWLTIKDNISFGLKMRNVEKETIERLCSDFIKEVGLDGFLNRYPHELSGGMKQRAALARVLVNKPMMMLMDEPLGALDAVTRKSMRELIKSLWEHTGCTIIMVTHDIEEALELATRLIVLKSRPSYIVKEYTDFSDEEKITEEIWQWLK